MTSGREMTAHEHIEKRPAIRRSTLLAAGIVIGVALLLDTVLLQFGWEAAIAVFVVFLVCFSIGVWVLSRTKVRW